MKTRRYLSLCLLAGVLAFGVGSAAPGLLGPAESATGVTAATSELVPVVLDDEPAARPGIPQTLLRRLHFQPA